MRALLASLLFLLSCLGQPAQAADAGSSSGPSADVAAIRQVVERFQAAIVAHDGKALDALFLAGHDSWIAVGDEASYAAVKARRPDAPKVLVGARRVFVDFIQKDTNPVEERFYKVRVDTNGTIGSVYFDFDFLENGKVTNRGSETWQMVRDTDGWKIAAMLYSMGK